MATGVITPPAFYGTDAAHFYQLLGMEGVVCGPGGKFNTMPDECVHIKDFLDIVRVYMLAILEICQPVEAWFFIDNINNGPPSARAMGGDRFQ